MHGYNKGQEKEKPKEVSLIDLDDEEKVPEETPEERRKRKG